MSLAIGASNAVSASLLAAYKNALANSKTGAASASSAGASASSAGASSSASPGVTGPGTVPAGDASAKARDSGASSAVQDFLSYAKETPAQRLSDSILKSMGLTEQDLQNMSPQKRAAVEKTIEQKLKQQAEQAAQKGKTGVIADVTA